MWDPIWTKSTSDLIGFTTLLPTVFADLTIVIDQLEWFTIELLSIHDLMPLNDLVCGGLFEGRRLAPTAPRSPLRRVKESITDRNCIERNSIWSMAISVCLSVCSRVVKYE